MAATETLRINRDSLSRLNSILSDSFYKDAIENSASYNTRLCMERKMRLPFLDAQTGVAQSDCALWMQKWQRMPGITEGQLYTYPAKRWRKKRRQYLMNDRYLTRYAKDAELAETENHQNNVLETTTTSTTTARLEAETDSADKLIEDSKDSWYKDIEDTSEPPDCGELDDPDSDYDEYEDTYRKKKRKIRNTRSKKKEKTEYSDIDKPYSCEICGVRYKTRPGLSYHYTHSHNNNGSTDNTEEETSYAPPKPATPAGGSASSSSGGTTSDDALAGLRKFQDSFLTFLKVPGNGQGQKKISASPYCDFCLGDSSENKKTRHAEELVSCADCGRSAHPTCLQFTPNMTSSVKKYRWQCIECKSCGLCGTSDNDDQLLFCDDCDRGYHMYCLTPPLSEPPEGSWSCHLCIEEYHKK